MEHRPAVGSVFPFSSYREYQEEILKEAADGLWHTPDIDNVIIDAPTGIGKSPINTALCRQAETAFMTTPQKKLRRQLEDDRDLNPFYHVLRSRADYQPCHAGEAESNEEFDSESGVQRTHDCESCPINRDANRTCSDQGDLCPYWVAKERAMQSDTTVLTFSYLIVDGHLETFLRYEDGSVEKKSFADRELLVVDEAHALEDQVASLHAGMAISPEAIPEPLFGAVSKQIERAVQNPGRNLQTLEDIDDILRDLRRDARELIDQYQRQIQRGRDVVWRRDEDINENLQEVEKTLRRLEWLTKDPTTWVVEPDTIYYNGEEIDILRLKPVFVAEFLQEHVWNRAEKRVLSTATMPFRDNPETWCERLGLDSSRTRFIHRPMPFDADRRQVHTRAMIDRFSSGGDEENWGRIVDTLELIQKHHEGEKGLVHTVSYDRASRLHEFFEGDAVLHRRDEPGVDESVYVQRWQDGDKDMLFSPSLMEGIDLEGGDCRWQVMLKVPYPNLSDARVHYLLNTEGDWEWYYESTAQSIIQSVGRGVRNKHDYCDYYVLDECFNDVLSRAAVPDWFHEAVVK